MIYLNCSLICFVRKVREYMRHRVLEEKESEGRDGDSLASLFVLKVSTITKKTLITTTI